MNNNLDIIVNSFKNGNKSDFCEIYNSTNKLVYRCALNLLKNDHDANDVVQNVFLKVYNKIYTLDDTTKFKTWLLSITYNETKNILMSKQKYNTHINNNIDIDMLESLNYKSDTPTPDEIVSITETNEILEILVDSLPKEQSKVLKLYYFENMSILGISSTLNIPKGTVKSRLNYARKKLKKSIETYENKNNIKLHSGILSWIYIEHLNQTQLHQCTWKLSSIGISTIGTIAIGINIYGIYNDWNTVNYFKSKDYSYNSNIDTYQMPTSIETTFENLQNHETFTTILNKEQSIITSLTIYNNQRNNNGDITTIPTTYNNQIQTTISTTTTPLISTEPTTFTTTTSTEPTTPTTTISTEPTTLTTTISTEPTTLTTTISTEPTTLTTTISTEPTTLTTTISTKQIIPTTTTTLTKHTTSTTRNTSY